MHFFVTGAAGFIGSHTAEALLARGHRVTGIDNLNDYYDVGLKKDRLRRLSDKSDFTFHAIDLGDPQSLLALDERDDIDRVIHLAAQAGVRYSLENPFSYAVSNLTGHLAVLEFCRHGAKKPMLAYASSSSVYGDGLAAPFHEDDPVDQPESLYAATKRADELMSSTYAKLYGIEQIGMRFFTVYGPWGRPDMAYWMFADRILRGLPIKVFNHGKMERDFTYIDDAVSGVLAVATGTPDFSSPARPHRIYNIGHNRPVRLLDFIQTLERVAGRKAILQFEPMQPGDVMQTCADITQMQTDFGYAPKISLEQGLSQFMDWFKAYRSVVA
ncbi:MAG: NAD-dependent epimerase/dehydratase family protein [Pseudomonadota bacterium]